MPAMVSSLGVALAHSTTSITIIISDKVYFIQEYNIYLDINMTIT